ncbi:MAG: sugar phosphate nucleotidyltransferase, partial [Planctomycetota bacterium]
RDLLVRTVSDPKLVDFGRHIIPKLVPEARVHAYVYRGYWEDVGTIQSYFDANLALCQPVPPFDFYDTARPVFSNPRFLPATKIEGSTVENALVAEGSVIVQAEIRHALIGIRARIGRGVRVTDSLILGNDYYETVEEVQRAAGSGLPPIGIGDDTIVRRAIIDKNARIGRGVRIVNEAGVLEKDGPGYFIREGIVIVPKNAAIADGTVV